MSCLCWPHLSALLGLVGWIAFYSFLVTRNFSPKYNQIFKVPSSARVVNMIAIVSFYCLFYEMHGFNQHHHPHHLIILCSRQRSEENVITVLIFLEMGTDTQKSMKCLGIAALAKAKASLERGLHFLAMYLIYVFLSQKKQNTYIFIFFHGGKYLCMQMLLHYIDP